MLVVPNSVSLQELGTLVGVAGLLNGAKVRLFQNDYIPNVGSAIADFTAATYDGYATSAAITWGTPFTDPVNGPVVLGDLKNFISTGPFTTPNTIYGYYVVDGAGTALLYGKRFATPSNIGGAGQNVPT